jgi:four helix bundle protein
LISDFGLRIAERMDKVELKERTKRFALRIIKLVNALPAGRFSDTIARQILRSGTSVGANYRACLRARSSAEFISKLGIVEEELDECLYWLELLADTKTIDKERLRNLENEANELISIIVSSIKTARSNSRSKK